MNKFAAAVVGPDVTARVSRATTRFAPGRRSGAS